MHNDARNRKHGRSAILLLGTCPAGNLSQRLGGMPGVLSVCVLTESRDCIVYLQWEKERRECYDMDCMAKQVPADIAGTFLIC